MSTCARVIAIAILGSLALSTAYAAPDDSVRQSAEGKWGKNFRYEIPTTGRLDKECGVIMEIIKRPKDSPTSAGEKIFLLMRSPGVMLDIEDGSGVIDFFRLFAVSEDQWCLISARSPGATFTYRHIGLRVAALVLAGIVVIGIPYYAFRRWRRATLPLQ